MDHGVGAAGAEEVQNQNQKNKTNMMQNGVEPPRAAPDQPGTIGKTLADRYRTIGADHSTLGGMPTGHISSIPDRISVDAV